MPNNRNVSSNIFNILPNLRRTESNRAQNENVPESLDATEALSGALSGALSEAVSSAAIESAETNTERYGFTNTFYESLPYEQTRLQDLSDVVAAAGPGSSLSYEVYPTTKANMKKSKITSKDINTKYVKNIRSEYQSLLEDIKEYNLDINKEYIDKIGSDIESIEKSNEQIKTLYFSLSQKESSVTSDIDSVKNSIRDKVNRIKFKTYIDKFDFYYKEKNWTNAEKCYSNATYIAIDDEMFKELESRKSQIVSARDEFEISNLCESIKKYKSGSGTSTTFNIIQKRLCTINLNKLSDENKQQIKDFLVSLSASSRTKVIALIFENKSYKTSLNLNLI